MELGEFSEHAHEQLGILLRDYGIEHFVGVGKFIKNALRYVNGQIFDTAEEAGEFINRNFKGPHLLLIKGSRAMKMEKILEIIKKGN
jgi:UDP-N-acetylmuramyl pentapeptide synthase